jgi:hypothetical protein
LIYELTPDQEAQIAVYREKWRSIALCTDRVDFEKTTAVIREAYSVIRREPPEIIFCQSPYAALQYLQQRVHPDQSLGKRLALKLGKQFHDRLFHWFKNNWASRFSTRFRGRFPQLYRSIFLH